MKIAVHLARHRRLVAWVGFSLLLHLLALTLIDTLVRPPPPPGTGTPLALRIAAAAAARPAAAQPAPAAPSAVAPALKPTTAPAEAPAPLAVRPHTAVEESTPATDAPMAAPAGAAGIAAMPMPGRYQVRPPPSARLSYAVTRGAPGQAAAATGSASLVWEKTGGAYRLRLDGVLGSLQSEGGEDDAGIAPSQASQEMAAGVQTTRFDRAAQRVEHGAPVASSPLQLGSQDRASALLQLAGMGLADPDQLQDVIEIVVAGPGGARIARWQVVGKEALDTPAGLLATVHLVQLAESGEARVEVWLAPQRNWLPVQLRVTGLDGSVANQVVTAIETQPGAAPATETAPAT